MEQNVIKVHYNLLLYHYQYNRYHLVSKYCKTSLISSLGPPHLLIHQLLDNAVILRWSPPLMDYIQFQYDITVVNSDNISVMLTTVTNSTNITLHKDNISYIECSQLQWSVSAGTQYGYSKLYSYC